MIKLTIDNWQITPTPIDLTVARSPVAKWYKGDKPDREISHEGFELGLFTVNDGTLYRDHAKPLLERIAKAVRGKYYSPRWEVRQWAAYISEAAAAYRQRVKADEVFSLHARAEATFYVAAHYRDHLADQYGIILPDLEQSK